MIQIPSYYVRTIRSTSVNYSMFSIHCKWLVSFLTISSDHSRWTSFAWPCVQRKFGTSDRLSVERKNKTGIYEPAFALTIADKYSIRSLMGIAYYTQPMRTASPMNDKFTDDEEEEVVQLTSEQKAHLLSGHWSLTRLLEDKLSKHLFNCAEPVECIHHHQRCVWP